VAAVKDRVVHLLQLLELQILAQAVVVDAQVVAVLLLQAVQV